MFGKKEDQDKRFIIINEQTINMIGITVIQDTETGVNYILGQGVNGLGITALLDKDGKPLVTEIK